jgi:cobalamin biosynthesis protein CobD/CbiB
MNTREMADAWAHVETCIENFRRHAVQVASWFAIDKGACS